MTLTILNIKSYLICIRKLMSWTFLFSTFQVCLKLAVPQSIKVHYLTHKNWLIFLAVTSQKYQSLMLNVNKCTYDRLTLMFLFVQTNPACVFFSHWKFLKNSFFDEKYSLQGFLKLISIAKLSQTVFLVLLKIK